MPSSEIKRKARKLLAVLKPLERGELLVEQLQEDINESLGELIENFNSKIKKLREDLLIELGERLKQIPDLSDTFLSLKSELEARLQEEGPRPHEGVGQ